MRNHKMIKPRLALALLLFSPLLGAQIYSYQPLYGLAPTAGTTPAGTETIPMVQSAANVTTTPAALKTYMGVIVQSNPGAVSNTTVGTSGIPSGVTGLYNSSFGNIALSSVSGGSDSTAMGYAAANAITGSNNLSAFGANSAYSDTGGLLDAFGINAGYWITTGTANVAIGANSLQGITGAHTTGASNTGVGNSALNACQGACNTNTALGASAGSSITTGSGNTIVGNAVASSTLTTGTNNVLIGTSASCTTAAAGSADTIRLCTSSTPLIGATGGGTPSTSVITIFGKENVVSDVQGNGVLLRSATAPTISSGFGTSPSVTHANGTASFSINVGTGGSATNGVVTLPTASDAWACSAADTGTTPTGQTEQTGTGTAAATFTNYSRTTGLAVAWTASEIIQISCWAN
jgi:hypothetical protein